MLAMALHDDLYAAFSICIYQQIGKTCLNSWVQVYLRLLKDDG